MHVLPKLASVPPVTHMPHFGNTAMIQIPILQSKKLRPRSGKVPPSVHNELEQELGLESKMPKSQTSHASGMLYMYLVLSGFCNSL